MGLDVGHCRTGGMSEGLQGADLIDHIGSQILGGNVDLAAPEAGVVVHLRANSDTSIDGGATRARQIRRISGLAAAGDVGAGDQPKHLLVIAQPPHPEALTEVCVQVHRPLAR